MTGRAPPPDADAPEQVEWAGKFVLAKRRGRWEYAARAGETGAFAFHPYLTTAKATYRVAATTAVGSHDANAFGLYDAYGNVAEWVQDCYVANYTGAPIDGSAVSPERCTRRVYRGGAYSDQSAALRSAVRKSAPPTLRLPTLGFRVVRDLN
mgnify:CR=1 FL=1